MSSPCQGRAGNLYQNRFLREAKHEKYQKNSPNRVISEDKDGDKDHRAPEGFVTDGLSKVSLQSLKVSMHE